MYIDWENTNILFDDNSKVRELINKHKWKINKKGYIVVYENGKYKSLHKMIWELYNGSVKKVDYVSFINDDKKDIRIANLLVKTKQIYDIEGRKITHRLKRIEAMEKIADYHNSSVECWKCHENKLCVLTIAHTNNDGKTDREKFINRILSGERQLDDINIECINCNCCKEWHGRYPDEIPNDDYRNPSKSL